MERMLQWRVTKRRLQRKWLLAPHQWKWPLMQNLPTIKNQDPEADGWPEFVFGNLLTQRHRRYQSDAHNQLSRRRRENCTGWCESDCCVRGRGRDHPHRVRQDHDEGDPDDFFFKAVKEDLMYRAISANDSVYNRTMTLKYKFIDVNDELEQDEWCRERDSHNEWRRVGCQDK